MYFDANMKVVYDTANQIFNMFKHYIKFNADASLPIKRRIHYWRNYRIYELNETLKVYDKERYHKVF